MKLDLTSRSAVEQKTSLGLATNQTVASLARPLAPLSISASIPHAIETLRHSNLDVYPVVSGPHFISLLSESELASSLLALSQDEHEQYRHMPLSTVVDPILSAITPNRIVLKSSPLSEAIAIFQESPDLSVLVVLDQSGFYYGVLSRSDVLAGCFRTLAPPRVGGMATPLGVYLTDGIDYGGVGNVALVLAGASLSALFLVAIAAINALDIYTLNHEHYDIQNALTIALLPIMPHYAATIADDLQHQVLPLLLMMLLLRAIPVAGYHAAEHQVVHCIERGEPLLPARVSSMPRPHPRCGTNLVAAVSLFGVYYSISCGYSDASTAVVPAALFTLLTWRQVGTFLQQHFTTRKASEVQIASGIKAGEDLLAKFRQNTNRHIKLPQRIWRMGFIQMLAGVGIFGAMVAAVLKYIPQLQPYLQGIN